VSLKWAGFVFFNVSAKVFKRDIFISHTGAFRLVVEALRVVLAELRRALVVWVVVSHAMTTIPLAVLTLFDPPAFSLAADRALRHALIVIWVNRSHPAMAALTIPAAKRISRHGSL
jgi:hypothetical protein